MADFPIEGTVSHGTLRFEDLIPAFLRALDTILDWRATSGMDSPDQVAEVGRAHDLAGHVERNRANVAEYFDSDEARHDYEELSDTLDALAAPHGLYFGTLEGDGSDFGFWPLEDEDWA